MFPSPTKEFRGMMLSDDNNDTQQLGLSLGPNVPYITEEKLSFLATYGLELDDDDDEEEEGEEADGSSSGGSKRFKRKKNTSQLLKKALQSPTAATPLASPIGGPRRTSKLVGLVTKPRSGSVVTGGWSPTKKLERPAPGRSYSVSDTVSPIAGRPRGMTTSKFTPFKDYSLSSPTPKASRRGHFDDDATDDDGASSLSHYPPSAIFEENDNAQDHTSLPTTEASSAGSRSSHAKHVSLMQSTPPTSNLEASSSDLPHDHLKVKVLPLPPLPPTMGDSDDSSSEKEFGPLTPPALPARPLGPGYIAPASASSTYLRRPTLVPSSNSHSSQRSSLSHSSRPPSKVEAKTPISIAEETANAKSAEEKATVAEATDKVAEKKATKEETNKLAAENKAAVAQEKAAQKKIESKMIQEERERKVLMKTYDELEVERFLADFGKHVTKVRSSGIMVEDPASADYWPKQENWRDSETGKLNMSGYAVTYLLSILSYLASGGSAHIQQSTTTPTESLEGPTAEEPFRIAALRNNAERLYMTALPMYEGTFAKLRKVWRWDSQFITLLWSASYFALWYRGLLLSALFGLCIWNVICIRLFPPKPEVIRQMLREQHQRSRELQQAKKAKAQDVIQEAQQEEESATKSSADTPAPIKKGKYRLAADATRKYGKVATFVTSAMADVHERIKNFVMWKSVPATWRAISLLAVAMVASSFSTPWIMARLPGFTLGVCLFIVAPIAEHRPEWLGVEWKNPFDFLLAGVPNDAQYAMQVLRTRAAAGEALTSDKDIAEWMKAGGDEEDDDVPLGESLIPTVPGLESVDSTMAVSTAVNQATAASSSSVDWKKWKSRVARGREMAVAGSEVLSGQRPLQLPRFAGSEQNIGSQEASTSKLMLGMAKGVNWGLDSIQNSSNRKLMERRLEGDEVMTASDGVYWAVHNGSCGHVVITPDKIRFRSMFARKMTPDAGEEQVVDVLDAKTGEIQVSEAQAQAAVVRTLVDVRLENVIQLKKTTTVNVGIWGIDGLEVQSKGGKSYQFSSIVKRDEAFNRILALAPQYWNKL